MKLSISSARQYNIEMYISYLQKNNVIKSCINKYSHKTNIYIYIYIYLYIYNNKKK